MDKSEISILVVDDHQVVLEKYVKFLEYAGYKKITTAKNGQEAWKILESNREHGESSWEVTKENDWEIKNPKKINLVITDVQMPKMNGLQLLEKIKGENRLKETLVIVMSTNLAYAEKAIELGADRFFSKMNISNLEETIKELFSK